MKLLNSQRTGSRRLGTKKNIQSKLTFVILVKISQGIKAHDTGLMQGVEPERKPKTRINRFLLLNPNRTVTFII